MNANLIIDIIIGVILIVDALSIFLGRGNDKYSLRLKKKYTDESVRRFILCEGVFCLLAGVIVLVSNFLGQGESTLAIWSLFIALGVLIVLVIILLILRAILLKKR